jgi:hypothetical protein
MKCVVAGRPTIREIFSIKLPIPDELKRMAEQMRKEQAARARGNKKANANLKALPAPKPAESDTVAQDVAPEESAETTAKPKLRKPVRVVKRT